MDTPLSESIARRLRDTLREELHRRTVELCVSRGFATDDQIRRAREEQGRLVSGGEAVSLLQVMLRLRFLTTQQYLGLADELGGGASPRQRLGRYELLREIGKGGIGTVYKAHDTQLRRIVALKTLRTDIAPAGVVAARLVREAQATAKLKHEGIVTVHDAGEIDGIPFIAMELVEGRHLGELLKERKTPREALVRIVQQAALAVAHAHDQGVVHRDLKPGNILVRADGRPCVIDFGLARTLDATEAKALTQSTIGTPFYMSPEQVRDSKSAGPPTDVYALGVTLYESLTGRVPFDGVTHFELFQQILTADPRRPRAMDPSIPAELETICLMAMAKEPRFRYASARALADDLGRWLKGEPIAARPPGIGRTLARMLARRAVPMATAAALVVAALAGGWWLRQRPFVQAKAEAERAFAGGDWTKALYEAERGLALKPDETLTLIAQDCRRRLESKSADADRLERHRRLQERLKPLEAAVRETRSFFYIKDTDIAAKLRALEETLAAVQKLANENEGFADAWTVLGMGWHLAGDLARAEKALRKAEGLAPTDGGVHVALGRVCLDLAMSELFVDESGTAGQQLARSRELTQRALKHFAAGGSGWGGALDRRLAEVAAALAGQQWDALRRLCEEGLREFGQELGGEEFWYFRSWAETGAERIRCFDRAIERRPHYAWAHVMRGNARREAWQIEGAIEDYTRALASNPRLPYAYNNRAVARYLRGEIDAAIDDYTNALKLDPSNATAYSNRSMAYGMKGRIDDGLADCDQAITLSPRSAGAYVNRGLLRFQKGDLEGALADYTRGLEFNPKSVAILVNRATARRTRGDIDGALEDLKAAMAADPSAGAPYVHRGLLKLERGDTAGALEDFHQAVRREPGNADARVGRARAKRGMDDYAGALADLDEAVRLNASNADAFAERGLTNALLQKSEAAMTDWDRALAINPRHAMSYFCRGTEHVVRGANDKAMADFDEAIRLNKAYVAALISRGILKEDTDLEAAIEDYHAALSIDPKSADALFNRGMAYQAQKKFEEAESDFEAALRFAPARWRNEGMAKQGLLAVRKALRKE